MLDALATDGAIAVFDQWGAAPAFLGAQLGRRESPGGSLSSRAVRLGIRVAQQLRVTPVLRFLARHLLPRRLQVWIQGRRLHLKLCAGEAELLVPEEALKRRYREALLALGDRHGVESLGDYLEFGVYTGTSLSCMYDVLDSLGWRHIRLFGFDSFEGLPEAAKTEDNGAWLPGMYKAPYEHTQANLSRKGVDWDRVTLVRGWFSDTLTDALREEHGITKASVIMIDSDLYSSAQAALAFSAPLIGDEAVILFDDWWPDTLGAWNLGEKAAFDEFLADHPEFTSRELHSYSGYAKVFLVTRLPPRA